MSKDIKRFIITASIVLGSIILIDIFIGIVLDKVMDKIPNFSGQLAKDNYRLHKMNEEIVILGSSRGSHHYVTKQLGDSINTHLNKKLTIYNAAIDGKFANSNSCAAEIIIDRYKPKLVIYDLSNGMLESEKFDDIIFSSPFYWKDSIVHRYIDNIGLKEKIIMKSSSYRYNGKLLRIFSSFLSPISNDDGYLPLYGTSIDTTIFKTKIKTATKTNPYTVNNFENVLKKYSEKEIPLIIVSSPQFRPNNENDDLKSICNKYNIPFIDIYNTDYFNNHPELFKDAGHLNDDGAHAYTAIFFDSLKHYLHLIKD